MPKFRSAQTIDGFWGLGAGGWGLGAGRVQAAGKCWETSVCKEGPGGVKEIGLAVWKICDFVALSCARVFSRRGQREPAVVYPR